jgi:formylglycine-generating enzyme required for sulfatase activity
MAERRIEADMSRNQLLLVALALAALAAAFFPSCSEGPIDSATTDDNASPADDDASPADDDDNDDDNDDDDISPVPLEWLPIPGGTFVMGCSPNDTQCVAPENPRHSVTVSAFQLTKSHITQQQFEEAVGVNPSSNPPCPNCPVETVDWADADSFCAAQGGRLPTEAEWEYAARAGTTTIYYCGDDPSCLASIGWYGEALGTADHPVCEKTLNAFGLCDMAGDVWQWTNDWYDATYYSSSPSVDPQGPTSGTLYVLRGGCWTFDAWFERSSNRYYGSPPLKDSNVGFRCAK